MNTVILTGRMTNSPELKETTSGNKYTRFTVAVDRIQEGTDFINCQAWNKTAEFITRWFVKGKPIMVTGRLQVSSYDKDGDKKTFTDVVVEKAEFMLKDNSAKEEVKDDMRGKFVQIDEEIPF